MGADGPSGTSCDGTEGDVSSGEGAALGKPPVGVLEQERALCKDVFDMYERCWDAASASTVIPVLPDGGKRSEGSIP